MNLFTNAGGWKPMVGGGDQLWVVETNFGKFSPAEFGTLSLGTQQPAVLLTNGVYRRIQRSKLV